MKKMKQIAFIIVLALSLTTFAACGKNNKDMNNGANNNSVTEKGTDANDTISSSNTATNHDTNNDLDRNDSGITGENMEKARENAKDAAEDTKDAIRDTGEAIKNGITGDDTTNTNNADNDGVTENNGR